MSDQTDIRQFVAGLLDQINALLQDFEQRSLIEHQNTRGKLAEIRDTLQEELDTRMSVAFSEIDEIKAARDDLLAAVALVRGVQQELGRLAAYLDRSTPRRIARLSYASIVMSAITLGLLLLHHWYLVVRFGQALIGSGG